MVDRLLLSKPDTEELKYNLTHGDCLKYGPSTTAKPILKLYDCTVFTVKYMLCVHSRAVSQSYNSTKLRAEATVRQGMTDRVGRYLRKDSCEISGVQRSPDVK